MKKNEKEEPVDFLRNGMTQGLTTYEKRFGIYSVDLSRAKPGYNPERDRSLLSTSCLHTDIYF